MDEQFETFLRLVHQMRHYQKALFKGDREAISSVKELEAKVDAAIEKLISGQRALFDA